MAERKTKIDGPRHELDQGHEAYPDAFHLISRPPERLYVIGDPFALQEGLAVVGARRATPYGLSCAKTFARMAAARGICIISGGARGCDAAAHEAAVEQGAQTVAFLGGGLDQLYPIDNAPLFQRIVDSGGAIVSEQEWGFKPLPFAFRERNRLIAGLARATLIVEAGLPSGTFSTADEALAAGKEVLAVPGSITSSHSRGANRLIWQGATPVVDEESFSQVLFQQFGCLLQEFGEMASGQGSSDAACKALIRDGFEGAELLLDAIRAQPLGIEELRGLAAQVCPDGDATSWLMMWLAHAERLGAVARYPDGRYGPVLAQVGRRIA